MKNLLKLEDFFLFNLALFLFSQMEYGWSTYSTVFGYGLKHENAFQNTHLGKIGQ